MNRELSMYADIVFKNGVVVTVDENDSICSAVAVRGNKIAYVGDDEGSKKWIGPETRVVDLNGRSLLPGFIDAHMHLGMRGMNAAVIVDCNSDDVPTIAGIQEKIREAASKVPEGTWIKATGYEQSKMVEGRHPTRDELDEAAPNHPVQLTRCCLHMGVYNSMALEIGKVRPEDFAPGEVVVDENGRMTGLLKERACTNMWGIVEYSYDEYMASFKACSDLLIQYGVTSVHDCSLYGERTMGLFQEACRKRIIQPRMYMLTYHAFGKQQTIDWIKSFCRTGMQGGLGDEFFRVGHAKILLDGSTSGPSCATRQPYSHDPDLKGIQLYTQEEASDILMLANRHGFNVTAHCVGDKAVEILVTAIENAIADCPREDARHRLDHCGLSDEELLDRIKATGSVVVSNPGFFNENAEVYCRYYGDRVNYMFPLKSYLEKGIITALGSDAPVIEADPMIGIYGAVARADKRSGVVAGECQKVSVLDAIRMYTYNGAYASLEEDIKGSIEPGKLADLVVLSENLLETPVDKIKSVKADMTVLDGEVVYER